MTYKNKQGGIKPFSSNETDKLIWEFCIDNTHISAAHIPGNHNILTDLDSSNIQNSAELMIEPRIFHYLIEQFGRPEIDILASRLNKQIRINI